MLLKKELPLRNFWTQVHLYSHRIMETFSSIVTQAFKLGTHKYSQQKQIEQAKVELLKLELQPIIHSFLSFSPIRMTEIHMLEPFDLMVQMILWLNSMKQAHNFQYPVK